MTIAAPSPMWSRPRDEMPDDLAAGQSVDAALYVGAPSPRRVVVTVQPCDEEVEPPRWLHQLADRFRRLHALGPNWNSHGAKQVQPEALVLAVRVLVAIATDPLPLPAVIPTFGGGVQLEWHDAAVDLEIEVDPLGSVEAWFRDRIEGREWEGDLGEREADARAALELIKSRRSAVPGVVNG